jgi:hypothetical protein
VIDSNALENWSTGTRLGDAEDVTTTNNFIKDNDDGRYLEGSDYIQVLYNHIPINPGTPSGFPLHSRSGENTVINGNNIEGNLPYGVFTECPTVDATSNWSGSPKGPCPELPNGKWVTKGDKVSSNVRYIPWSPRPIEF